MDYGFCDLCVHASTNKRNLRETLLKLYNVGYNTVALNQNVDENVFHNEKKKKKKTDENDTVIPCIPEPIDVNDLLEEFKGKLNILHRITFSFSDPIKTHSLNQLPILNKYNLYAIIPKSQVAFQFACSQLNVDIITINSTSSHIKLSRKLYSQAIEKGIHFEINYSDVINTSTRKLAIYHSHLLYTFGKSKNVIISSGANNHYSIRNPYDIINLARLLGLNEVKAKCSILQQAHRVLLKGEGRRCRKAIFRIYRDTDDDLKLHDPAAKRLKS
ncbi:PREDICTED: ribonuclease P protein subunit p30 [Ceratosolen solmsi marchali]|uniref:Ribonuclease P protein subunit p30 n=1 Tax=Ceratosolen solmsi marchali TaxID=326594 RepID=A0AAJ6YBD8_9HYME|nr:PREDICTED: ribonuclease P protein subunit p30 [Ceratosolen solmsi marchali]